MLRREFSQTLLSGCALGALGGWSLNAGAQGGPVEGKHFQRFASPIPTSTPGKIEVLEFFSYGCPHCAQLEPQLHSWAQRQAADVVVKRVPVPFLSNPKNFQQIYYTLEAMNLVDAMQVKVFTAVHVDKVRLDNLDAILALMGRHGVDTAKFKELFNSFSVATKAAQTRKLIEQYQIDSVPTLCLGGQYKTDAAMAGGHAQALAVADVLIQRLRGKA